MIRSESRYPLFGIMPWPNHRGRRRRGREPLNATATGKSMDRSIVIHATDHETREDITAHDISAMVSMLDYLIGRVGEFDVVSAHCLGLARKTLVAAADRYGKPN
jgi:hypothetical protein